MVQKLNSFTFNHADQPDVLTPGVYSSSQLKTNFDSRAEQLRVLSNSIIDDIGLGNTPIYVTAPPYNASGLATTAVGSITTGTKLLTLTTTPDFVAGQGINLQGAFEVASLLVGAAATVSSNVTVTLNGVAFTVAVVSGDTAIQVATKIRAATYTGWTAGGTAGTTTVTFTSTTTGTKTDAAYSAGTTTATGTMTTTTQGTADQISTVSSISGYVVTIADNATRTISAGTFLHDDTASIVAAIAAIATTEYTEAIPTQGARGKVIVPAGKYNISSKITMSSYISFEGAGKDATILVSQINNGDPVLNVSHNDSVKEQQFYNALRSFTIDGNGHLCIGIKFNSTSRWIMDDIMINNTQYEGLYMYESYLGEIRSCLIRACGDATHYSVKYDGSTPSFGSHAVNMYGGEINGGGTSVNGVHLKYGASVGFYGTAIEGFSTGNGFTNEGGVSCMVIGCDFESNKQHIVETGATFGSSYLGNYMATPSAGTLGHIGIYFASGARIEGNYMQGAVTHIYDSNGTSGKLRMSSVKTNVTSAFPMTIAASIVTDASTTGTIMEMFDGNFSVFVYGRQRFKDILIFDEQVRPTKGMYLIGDNDNVSTSTGPSLTAGFGAPESLRTAYPGSLYLRKDSTTDHLYIKDTGANTNTGWRQYQGIISGTTANRPTGVIIGTMYYDTTLGKAVWVHSLGPTVWHDGAGSVV